MTLIHRKIVNNAPYAEEALMVKKKSQPLSVINGNRLLERAVSVYEKNFNDDCQQYLAKYGIIDKSLITKNHVGFCNGKLKEILPRSGDVISGLKDIGILTKQSKEFFSGCIVFPVYDIEGNIITLCGYNIKNNSIKYLPKRPNGIWNIRSVKSRSEIIITETILDALSIEMAGFPNVISIQKPADLTPDHIHLFNEYGIKKCTIIYRGDKSGKKTASELQKKLKSFSLEIKHLPEKHSVNSYLVKYGADKLAEFIKSDSNTIQAEPETPPAEPPSDLSPGTDSFTINCGKRSYQIIGLQKGVRKLKATIRLEHTGKLHVDTLDFYSARARRMLEKDISRIFSEVPEKIEADITRILVECEKAPVVELKQESEKPYSMTEEERKEAVKFGKSPNLINQIKKDFDACGLIGEDKSKVFAYIAMTSRKLDTPTSVMMLAGSGSGKSAFQEGVTTFCPPEDIETVTALSGKALFYKDTHSLKHKVLAIEEMEGAESASYAIRSLISSGVLISESTIKDFNSGKLVTMSTRVEGPTVVFYTTTNPMTDPETMSRFFVLGIDESREQTKKILAYQRKNFAHDSVKKQKKIKAIINKHHNFQRSLKPYLIKNQYAPQLTFLDDRLQSRRDQPKYLSVINAVCLMRQMQKEVKYENDVPYISVDTEDIRITNDLIREILGRSLDELSSPGRNLLIILDEMVEKRAKKSRDYIERTDVVFTRRDIREYAGWSNSRLHRYIRELVELEYVLVESGRNGSKYRYRLAYEGQGKDGGKFMLGLKDVEELKTG